MVGEQNGCYVWWPHSLGFMTKKPLKGLCSLTFYILENIYHDRENCATLYRVAVKSAVVKPIYRIRNCLQDYLHMISEDPRNKKEIMLGRIS